MTNKLLKLAKMLLKFSEINTDKGVLTVNEDLAPGIEVYITDENGEYIAAPDGEYLTETSKIEVKDGKVESVETIEPEDKEPDPDPAVEENLEDEKPAEEPENPEPDEKDLRISELEGLLKDRDSIISELTAKIKELEEKLNKPVEDPIEMKTQAQDGKKNDQKINPALKYFQD